MEIHNPAELFSSGGVIPLLLWVASVGSLERGATYIESKDLLRAIYVADLEHVSKYWEDWENFEQIVSTGKLVNGVTIDYLNRVLYLVRLYVAASENSGSGELTKLSREVIAIVGRAKSFAIARSGPDTTPSSRGMLLSIYDEDSELAGVLRDSRLKIEKLRSDVTGGRSASA